MTPNNTQSLTYEQWNKLKPVYIQKWVWLFINKKNPSKYPLSLPVYQNQKVILT